MTVTEMSREFDILYDNISSNAAPGINNYEKSLFLTRAQDEIIKERYSPYNKLQKGFEASENRRVELRNLVLPYSANSYTTNESGIDPNSKFFYIPNDVYYIIQEEVTLGNTASDCIDGKRVEVKPITHDEYNVQKKSPFRKPNERKVWRVDINVKGFQGKTSTPSEVNMVEIISPNDITVYRMRYIKRPDPIIISNFDTDPELEGMNLTIDGKNTITQCELNEEIHRDIISRAVELAIRAYRENSLQANVELNNRNV